MPFPESDGMITEGGCTALPISGKDFPNIVIATNNQLPAQGIQPPRIETFLTLYEGLTFEQLWRAKLYEVNGTDTHYSCGQPIMSTTTDSRWIVIRRAENPLIVEVATGRVRNIPNADFAAAAGDYVVTQNAKDPILSVLDPETLTTVHAEEGNGTDTAQWVLSGFIGSGVNGAIDARRALMSSGSSPHFGVLDIPTGRISESNTDYVTDGHIIAPDTNTLYSREGRGLTATDLTTMQEKWNIDIDGVGSFCGGLGNLVLARTNGQLALLDATTGQQIQFAYYPDDCGVWNGKYLYVESGSGYSIYQVFN